MRINLFLEEYLQKMNLYPDFFVGLSCGVCMSFAYFVLRKYIKSGPEVVKAVKKTSPKFSSKSEYKMVLVVRNDLSMTKGKIMSQCCHAAVGAYEEIQKRDIGSMRKWQRTGQAKVAVKSNSLEEVNKIAEEAEKLGIVTFRVIDDGKTQVDHDTLTCLSVGPAPKEVIDKITGHLKLL